MTGIEIGVTVAGTIGLADIIRIIIEKIFSKKKEKVENQKDEFSVLRERLDYNEKELNRLNKNQICDRRKISKLYAFLVRITPDTCTKKDCKYRELISIDFDEFENKNEDDEKDDMKPDEIEQQ